MYRKKAALTTKGRTQRAHLASLDRALFVSSLMADLD
jgi:hypothetical protein